MKLPTRHEKGFTLVELLIVLAILAVLAAVVIPNVTGMFGRGAKQSFSTDSKTIQTAVATFYFDTHTMFSDTYWDGSGVEDLLPGHYYPTADGSIYPGLVIETTPTEPEVTGLRERTYLVWDNESSVEADDTDIIGAAIWMGLLVNIPTGLVDGANPLTATLADEEDGPYLNEPPQSSSFYGAGQLWGNGNPNEPGGTYTWIILENGQVVGCAHGLTTDTKGKWYAGFNGTYP